MGRTLFLGILNIDLVPFFFWSKWAYELEFSSFHFKRFLSIMNQPFDTTLFNFFLCEITRLK